MRSALGEWQSWGLPLSSQPLFVNFFTRGLSHHTYLIDADGRLLVLKQYKKSVTDVFSVNSKSEASFGALAYQCGIGPEIIYRGSDYLVMEYLPFDHPKTPLDNLLTCRKIGSSLKALHQMESSAEDLCLSKYLENYWDLIDVRSTVEINEDLVNWLSSIRSDLSKLVLKFDEQVSRRVTSHCDLTANNLLVSDKACYFLDWEYAKKADPLIDLASLVINLELNTGCQEALMESYGNESVDLYRLPVAIGVVRYMELIWYALQGLPRGFSIERAKYQLSEAIRLL